MRTTRHDISHLTERYALVALAIFALILALATLARAVDEDDIVYYQMGAGGQLTERTVAPADYGTLGLDVDGHLVVRHDVLDASGNSKIPPALPASWCWVQQTTGNDGTGTWGNPALPYATLDAALEERPSGPITIFVRGSVGNVSVTGITADDLKLTIIADGGPITIGSVSFTAASGAAANYYISFVGEANVGSMSFIADDGYGGAAVQIHGGSISGIAANGNGSVSAAGGGGSVNLCGTHLLSGISASADDSEASLTDASGGSIILKNCTTEGSASMSVEPVNAGSGGAVVIYGNIGGCSPSGSATVSGFGRYYDGANWVDVNS